MYTLKTVSLLLCAVSFCGAQEIQPAAAAHQATAATVRPAQERIAAAIANAAADGYSLVVVDLRDITWKEEKATMKRLQDLGYKVELHPDQAVYGYNKLNGGLLIKW